MEVAAIGWAIGAVGWLVSPCISKLLDRALAKMQSSKERKDRIRSLLTETIPQLKLALEAVESSESKHFFEDLVTRLRSTYYATEDILDEIEYARRLDMSTNKGVGNPSRFTIPPLLLHGLKENVKEIEELVSEASRNIKFTNLQPKKRKIDKVIPNVTANDTKTPTTSDRTARVTGRVKEVQDIIEMLRQRSSSDSTQLSVIGIIGIPGSGKTTLAQCVFKSESDSRYFDLVMWIYVSENFSVKTIHSEMFQQAWNKSGRDDKNRPHYDSPETLTKELNNLLKEKKILLVLDDVWFSKDPAAQDDLELLLSPLKDGKGGSKILLTSRQDSLSYLGPDVASKKYEIPDMDDEDFLKLFMHHALNITNVKSEHVPKFQEIGARIAEKLKKSPLLAITVGRTLFRRRKVEVIDWINVRDENLLSDHMGALWWCYQHLGEHVRRCFAYCSIFPRRYHLHRDELVNLWAAQGFINTTKGGEEMEKVGRNYFEELVSTSFLLPRGTDKHGEYFLIHDLLYDLAVNVAGSDCLKIENGLTEEPSLDVRHIFIQNCTASMLTDHIVKLKKLRTLIIHSADPKENFDTIFRSLPKLRVFIFKFSSESERSYISFSKSINGLKLLRYLGVSRTSGRSYDFTLPSTLHKLYLLQVIDLGSVLHVHSPIHQDMSNLVDLRHIIIIGGFCFQNIGGLTLLQTIPKFVVARLPGNELHQLKHLNKLQGKLHIRGLEHVHCKEEAVEAKLSDKEGLTELVLEWNFRDYHRPDIQADVLEVLRPSKYLTQLTIDGYKSSRYPSWMVGPQKNTTYHLDELKLIFCSQPACAPELFFIGVSSLVLRNCEWDTVPYNMEGLKSLILYDCTLPSNMEFLTSLKSMIIRNSRSQTLPSLPRSLDYIDVISSNCNLREDHNWEKVNHIRHIVCNCEVLRDLGTAGTDGADSSLNEDSEATGSGGSAQPSTAMEE